MGISFISLNPLAILTPSLPPSPSQLTPPPLSKHRAPNNKHPLLFPPDPLDNLIRALRQRRATRIRRRHGIQFEQRRTPRERNGRCIRFVVDLEGRWFIVHV
jgi:hypothetical protein